MTEREREYLERKGLVNDDGSIRCEYCDGDGEGDHGPCPDCDGEGVLPERPERFDVARDGYVHVLSEMCATCVFRPGNPMRLQAGRLRGMVDEALAADGSIICHSTLYGGAEHHAVCRGFFDRHARDVVPLRAALMCERVRFVPPPPTKTLGAPAPDPTKETR